MLSLPAGKDRGRGLSDKEGVEDFVTRFESIFGCTEEVEVRAVEVEAIGGGGGGGGGAERASAPSPPPPTIPPAALSLLFTGTLRLGIGDGLGGLNGFDGDFVFLSAARWDAGAVVL